MVFKKEEFHRCAKQKERAKKGCVVSYVVFDSEAEKKKRDRVEDLRRDGVGI